MKQNFLNLFIALFISSMHSQANAFDLKACISDEFGDLYNITVQNYKGPGNIKTVTGQADLLTGVLWDVSGTLNKSTKTFYLVSTNPVQTYCNPYSDVVYDTMTYTGNLIMVYDSWSNDCPGGFGSLFVTANLGACTFQNQRLGNQVPSAKVLNKDSKQTITIEVFPNPVNDQASVHYILPEKTNVQISVYNSLGQLQVVLVNESQTGGSYIVNWDITNIEHARLSNGLYFLRMTSKAGIKSVPILVE